MEVRVEFFSCYERTYKAIYADVLNRIYGSQLNTKSVKLSIIDTSENGTKNIQAQRSVNENSIYKGRLINIYEDNILKHIVGISNTNYDEDRKYEFDAGTSNKDKSQYGADNYHANTYLKQGINQIFEYYFDNKDTADLSFYLLDLNKGKNYPNNLFNTLSYRELETIGFKVLNIADVDFSDYEEKCKSKINKQALKFSSFNKYLRDIAYISGKNRGNDPSYLQCDEREIVDADGQLSYTTDRYTYTFKSLSAQQYDSLLRCWCLKVLADQESLEIEFKLGRQYFDFDNEERKVAEKLSKPVEKIFQLADLNIEYITNDQFMDEKRKSDNTYLRYKEDSKIRNQVLFRNNIRRKGIPTECVICGECDTGLLDAAHLWEVNQIKASSIKEINSFIKENCLNDSISSSSEYSGDAFYKKYYLANSGDNGVWLCKNHHKMFDLDYYYFDPDFGNVTLEFPSQESASKFKDELKQTNLNEDIMTPLTKAFLSKRIEDNKTK